MSKDVGFGIRIEDAVLVTADGGIVMTGARAKSPYEP
jgi:Xaa-Pro aminopeptidase